MLLSQALRSLQRAPTYALTVILTLALGLAALGSMATVVHGLLLAPLPYVAPERLVRLDLQLADGGRISQSPAIYRLYQQSATQLEAVAMYRVGDANVWSGAAGSDAEHQRVGWICPSTLPLLGVLPRLGRNFSADEGQRGGPEAVILSDAEWRRRYAAAEDVLGRTLIVNDVPREVIGVMPAGFAFPDAGTTLWLPAKVSAGSTAGDFLYRLLGRLGAGASPGSAERELATLLPALAADYPQLQSGGSTANWLADARPEPRVQPLGTALTGELAPTLWMLVAVAGLVLLVAWANVAHLLLVRADRQRQDVALRRALGASTLRASARALSEVLLLNLAAAVLALLLTGAALAALRRLGPATLPRLHELALDGWSVGLVLLLALLSGLAGSALLLQRAGPSAPLQATPRQTSGRSSERLRSVVTVVQIAVALVVLAGATLLARTAAELHAVRPGFEAAQVTSFRILLPFARYPDAARVAFHARLTEQVRQLPGVHAAGLVARLPLGSGQTPEQDFRLDGEDRLQRLPVNVVGAGYFAALRIPLLAGRDFRAPEGQRADELIISRRVATTLFADPSGVAALGRRLSLEPGGPRYTIVGVVGDVQHNDLAEAAEPMLYRPQVLAATPTQPGPLPAMTLVVRADVPEAALASAIRAILRELDPGLPVFEVRGMREVVDDSMARVRLLLSVLSAAAGVTLLLGMVGLYGVIAYDVALRTREFGVRIALGATPQAVLREVLARGLQLTAIGIGAGLLLWLLALPYLRAAVAGISAADPVALLLAMALLSGAALLASGLPARRAVRISPAEALRAD
ncbi:MAG: ADOP family duplicated permease [Xanthomonadales bacterium]|nr:ADOP family duplicated permease [Xanthomonadales bacterium]